MRNLKKTVMSLLKDIEIGNQNEMYENGINSNFSKLAKLYSQDCKTVSDDLKKSQKILVGLRQDLREYTTRHTLDAQQPSHKKKNNCFGCANSFIKLFLELFSQVFFKSFLKVIIFWLKLTAANIRTPSLVRAIPHLFINIHHGSAQTRTLARHLICLLASDEESTHVVNKLMESSVGFVLDNLDRSINVNQVMLTHLSY